MRTITKQSFPFIFLGINSQFETILSNQNNLIYSDHYTFFRCDLNEFRLKAQHYESLILIMEYDEVQEFKEEIQEIFNIAYFMNVQKIVCYIISCIKIKNIQWKESILNMYYNQSQDIFQHLNKINSILHVISIQTIQEISNLTYYLDSTPQNEEFNFEQESFIQIINNDNNEQQILIKKGCIWKTQTLYAQNQKFEKFYVNILQDDKIILDNKKQLYKIKINNEQNKLENIILLSNIPFNIQVNDQLIAKLYFTNTNNFEQFLSNYRNTQYKLLVQEKEYNVTKCELHPSSCFIQNQAIIKFTVNSLLVKKFNQDFSQCLNSSFLLIDQISNSLSAYGHIIEDNFTIQKELINNIQKNGKQDLNIIYLPFTEQNIIEKIERGELQQKGQYLINCRKCMETKANTLLLPCNHIRYCYDCAIEEVDCLYCDQKIEKRKKIELKLIDPEQDRLLNSIPENYNQLLQICIKKMNFIQEALKINELKSSIQFDQYYCYKCEKQKIKNYTCCENDHLNGYCEKCIKQTNQECQIIKCQKKIIYQGPLTYLYDE